LQYALLAPYSLPVRNFSVTSNENWVCSKEKENVLKERWGLIESWEARGFSLGNGEEPKPKSAEPRNSITTV